MHTHISNIYNPPSTYLINTSTHVYAAERYAVHIPYQPHSHTLSTHSLNIPTPTSLSTHLINTPYHTVGTGKGRAHIIHTHTPLHIPSCHHTLLSSHPLIITYQHTLSHSRIIPQVRAREERAAMQTLFLEWAAGHCEDAALINTASSAQIGESTYLTGFDTHSLMIYFLT